MERRCERIVTVCGVNMKVLSTLCVRTSDLQHARDHLLVFFAERDVVEGFCELDYLWSLLSCGDVVTLLRNSWSGHLVCGAGMDRRSPEMVPICLNDPRIPVTVTLSLYRRNGGQHG